MDSFSCQAWLWNGSSKLEGNLFLSDEKLIFKPQVFSDGNLKIEICIENIENIETFLLFGLSKNGIKIITDNGKEDRFILENIPRFKNALSQKMKIAK